MEKQDEILVNVHGLLGYVHSVQLPLDAKQTNIGSRFIHEKVAYKVIQKIDQDVVYPIIQVIALDIFV